MKTIHLIILGCVGLCIGVLGGMFATGMLDPYLVVVAAGANRDAGAPNAGLEE